MQVAKHCGELLEWSRVGIGGAVTIHEDRGVLAGGQACAQGRKRVQRRDHGTRVSRNNAKRQADHAGTSSVAGIYVHILGSSGVIVRSPGLALG